METAGATVNKILEVIVFKSVSFEIPIFLPCFHDLIIKNNDCANINAIMEKAIPYITGLSLKFSNNTTPVINF
jgi:hypothetical protein